MHCARFPLQPCHLSLIVVNIENLVVTTMPGNEVHPLVPCDVPVCPAVVAALTRRPADRRCRRIDSRRSLLSAPVVLVKARYQFADVLLDPGGRYADQRRL